MWGLIHMGRLKPFSQTVDYDENNPERQPECLILNGINNNKDKTCLWRHDIQHNDIQHNGLIFDTQHNCTISRVLLCWVPFCWVTRLFRCYDECHYAECRYAECHYAECRYAECRCAECHGAMPLRQRSKGSSTWVGTSLEPYSQPIFFSQLENGPNKLERLSLQVFSSLV